MYRTRLALVAVLLLFTLRGGQDLLAKPTRTPARGEAQDARGPRKARSVRVERTHLSRPDREVVEYARGLGLLRNAADRPSRTSPSRTKVDSLRRRILAREKRQAQRLDRRNTPRLIDAVNARFDAAQRMKPPRARVLFGFSRSIDKKLRLDNASLGALAAGLDSARVRRLIDRGPGPDGKWGNQGTVDSVEELVAAITHHQIHGKARALQISIDPKVQEAIEKQLSAVAMESAVGSASAFGANIAASYPTLDPSFHSAQTLSTEQADLFSDRVRVVTRESGPGGQGSRRGDPSSPTKVNYIVEVPPNQELSLFGRESQGGLRIKTYNKHGRIILSTKSTDRPTFDLRMGKRQLADLARENDIFVAAGLHYLTGYGAKEAREVGAKLRQQLETMRSANRKLYVHYQYVRAKDPAKEHLLFSAVHGQVDSISLNAVELAELCSNLEGHVIDPARGPVKMPRFSRGPRVDPDNPRRIYKLARALMDATGIDRVRIHGLQVDLTLVKNGSAAQMEAEALGAHHARSVAANKVANRNGQIVRSGDRWNVLASVEPKGMAAMQSLADMLQQRRALEPADRNRFITEGTYVAQRKGEVSVAATPIRSFYDMRGGLVSTGDTLDLASLFAVGPGLLSENR